MGLIDPPDRSLLRSLRSPKPRIDPHRHQGYKIEREPVVGGRSISSATYFLTGGECRFTCSFCDLWKYTLDSPTPKGSLVHQIRSLHEVVLGEHSDVEWLKLYNASNFFDPYNVPIDDYEEIASLCSGFGRIIVENHAKITASKRGQVFIRSFASMLRPTLEVAMGLETVDPDAVALMNKSMAREDFDRACDFLTRAGIAIRVFVILQPPGTAAGSSIDWVLASCRHAFDRGVQHCSILPARPGSGWVDDLERRGMWTPPDMKLTESALRTVLEERESPNQLATLDLWDWNSLAGGCPDCRNKRYDCLLSMNLEQRPVPRDPCPHCEG
jgi:radical SAM enzyme (TIGR01210 family)